jgi:hypothetical protein
VVVAVGNCYRNEKEAVEVVEEEEGGKTREEKNDW